MLVEKAKTVLDYRLSDSLKMMVVEYRSYILSEFTNCEIYLFGSVAKGNMKKTSDIDFLVLLKHKEVESREKLKIRIKILNDMTDNFISFEREADVKIYGEIDFKELCETSNFEKSILKDLVYIGGNCYD